MNNRSAKWHPVLSVLILLSIVFYLVSGILSYRSIQKKNSLLKLLGKVEMHDCRLSSGSELLRHGVKHGRDQQRQWLDELEAYSNSINLFFDWSYSASSNGVVREEIPKLRKIWNLTYRQISLAKPEMDAFRYVPDNNALSAYLSEYPEMIPRKERYALAKLNYVLEVYDCFLKEILSERLAYISNELQVYIDRSKDRLILQLIVIVPVVGIVVLLLLMALLRSEARNQQRTLQLQQMQKLEALGRASGRISHDFKNILTGIVGFAELGKIEENCFDPFDLYFSEILSAANRAVELSSSIVKLSRDDFGSYKKIDLVSIMSEAVHLIKVIIPDAISVAVHLPSKGLMIEGNPTQLYQVFMNLSINASHAIADKGVITISVNPEDDLVNILIADTGSGIESEHIPYIFQSGFTTKAEESGSGFGLFIVKEIIENHGGTIDVESQYGAGTTFSIKLPLVDR